MAEKDVARDLSQILWENDTNFLISNDNEQIPVDSLVGKIVGLYFAGSWFRLCQNFTPELVELHKKLGSTESNKFEVVYISCDLTEESFNEYYSEMPWPAVPFSDSKTRVRLKNFYNVLGFPTLVILDENGKVRSNNATKIVWDYGAEAFPFASERIKFLEERDRKDNEVQTVSSLLDSTDYLISKNGDQVKVSVSDIDNQTVGLYFWKKDDVKCNRFDTLLWKVYKELNQTGKKFEVVLIPQDQSETQYGEEFEETPWLTMPFTEENVNKAEKLTLQFNIENLPGLVIIGPNGKTTISNAVELIKEHGSGAFPFTSKKIAQLAEIDTHLREAVTMESLLISENKDSVMRKDGSSRRVLKLVGYHILLYFSAQHFTESETFLKKLMKTYSELEKKIENIAVIFVSRDRDLSNFFGYFTKMPWYALPYQDKRSSSLIKRFNILEHDEHPKVVVINGICDRIVTTKAVQMIKSFGDGAFPFEEDFVESLADTVVTMDQGWRRKLKSDKHEHELELIFSSKYCCSDCSEDGWGLTYCCEDCNFNLDIHCVRP